MCVFVCVCVYCAGGLYIIYDLGGRLLHVVCVYCAGGLYIVGRVRDSCVCEIAGQSGACLCPSFWDGGRAMEEGRAL